MDTCPNCGLKVKNTRIHLGMGVCSPPEQSGGPVAGPAEGARDTQAQAPTHQIAPEPVRCREHPELEQNVEKYRNGVPLIDEICPICAIPNRGSTWKVKSDEKSEEAAPATTKESPSNGQYFVFMPEVDPHFLVSEDIAGELEVAHNLSSQTQVNILITGQPGGGKTSLGLQFAAKYNRPCVVVDFGVLQEPQELFHTTRLEVSANGSRTDIRESGFVKGLETKRCVVVLDELNRPENERVLNVLMPFLDKRGQSYIDYLRRLVKVAPGVIFVATLNEGAMFCGVSSIDTALRDRFREIHMPYLPAAQEAAAVQKKTGIPDKIAFTLADMAARVRNNPAIGMKVSTRQLLTAAENYSVGDPLWRAVSTSIGHFNDPAWREKVMEILSFCLLDETEKKKWEEAKAKEKSGGIRYAIL